MLWFSAPNIQQPTLNAEQTGRFDNSAFGVRCWAFDVSANPQLL